MSSTSAMSDPAATFEPYRRRLRGLSYRMLGSMADAEDAVQETYLRWHGVDRNKVSDPKAFLMTTTARICLDMLTSARARREEYVGPWLPEPVLDTAALAPDSRTELAEDLSIALLLTLDRLSALERAAFLLHDVFDVGYGEIASVIEKSEPACRQVVHRARERVRGDRARFDVTESARTSLFSKFTAALEARDEQALLALFAPDATWTADGGGKVGAAPAPIVGAARIAKLVIGLREKFWAVNRTLEIATVNGESALVIRDGGQLTATMSIATDGDRIVAVYAVLNPEKLGRP